MDPRPATRSSPAREDRPARTREVAYRSTQAMLALWLLLPPTSALSAALTWVPGVPSLLALLLAALPFLLVLLLGRLVIELRGGHVCWSYGFIGWPRWKVDISEIAEVQLGRGPSAHAGIQFKGTLRVFTASLGSPAVEILLHDGRRVLLGSPEPERLAQFIRVRLPGRR